MASITVKTADQIRTDYLNTISAGYQQRGIQQPNVSYGSKYYVDGTALSQQIAVAFAAVQSLGDALMPDTAQGQDLINYAANYGLYPRPATGSVGTIILGTTILPTQTILISAGQQLQDQNGLIYSVITTGAYADGYSIAVQSVDTGVGTKLPSSYDPNDNLLPNPTILRWITIPPFAQATAYVGTAFVGGAEAETVEQLRVRLLQKLSTPPGGGNWSQVADIAEASSPAVQKSFIYPCCDGPATVGVAITSAPIFGSNPALNYAGRDFAGDPLQTVLNQSVIPAVIGNFPEFANFIITQCQNQTCDISIGLTLPNATTATQPGNGQGWIDANPFPIPPISAGNYTVGHCAASSVNSFGTQFSVVSDPSALPAGSGTLVNICWVSSNDFILRTALATVSGASSPYLVTLQPGYAFIDSDGQTIKTGDSVFPGALNMQTYVSALLSQYASLGPGQKIDPCLLTGLFPRANRRPLFQEQFPSNLGTSILKFIDQTGQEVLDVQYLFRQDVINPGNTNTPTNPSPTAGQCPIPSSVLLGPYVLTARRLAFYPILGN